MTSFNYKKIFSILVVFLVALATGFSIGKIYIDQNTAPPDSNKTYSEIASSNNELLNLYNLSQTKSVMDFNGLELYQLAEYKLTLEENFMYEMLGQVNSTGQVINLKSIKSKINNVYSYYKLSPSKSVLGITTPPICNRVSYNLKSKAISITKGSFTVSGPEPKDLQASFSGNGESWTEENYIKQFKANPIQTVMPYIISSKTCPAKNVSEVVNNGDGTYSFDITLTGHDVLKDAALCYTQEIMYSCGYESPRIEWTSLKINVTVDSNFKFKAVNYDEKYTLYSPSIPALKRANIEDDFKSIFYYGEDVVVDMEVR